MKKIVIVGGHGKIALLTAPKLAAAGFSVDSLIRNPDQRDDVVAAHAKPVLLDIEQADVGALAEAFSGAEAVVFSAGAGGGDAARTRAVDFEAAVRTMDAAERAGVKRYVMVSYVRAETDVDRLDSSDSFFPYAKAKHDADAYLRDTDLDYAILGPGSLTLESASGKIQLVDANGENPDRELAGDEKATSRENVAEVIVYVLAAGARAGAAPRRTINFYDGDTPIAQALASG